MTVSVQRRSFGQNFESHFILCISHSHPSSLRLFACKTFSLLENVHIRELNLTNYCLCNPLYDFTRACSLCRTIASLHARAIDRHGARMGETVYGGCGRRLRGDGGVARGDVAAGRLLSGAASGGGDAVVAAEQVQGLALLCLPRLPPLYLLQPRRRRRLPAPARDSEVRAGGGGGLQGIEWGSGLEGRGCRGPSHSGLRQILRRRPRRQMIPRRRLQAGLEAWRRRAVDG